MQLPHVSAGFLISLGISTAFEILFPLALAFYVSRRLHVRWRYFWYGVAVFAAVQLFTRVPAVYVIQQLIAPQLKSSQTFLWIWLFILALTAGLFEEVGRYFGYRIFMGKEEKTWSKGVMYGIGHGGLESIVLVGLLSAVSLVNILVIQSLDITKLPAAQQTALHDQFATLAAQPGWLPLLGGYERLCAIAFHIAMSIVVLQAFRRGHIRWLWYAVGLHFLFDFGAVAIATGLPKLASGLDATAVALITEGWVTLFAALSLWLIFTLRDEATPRDENAASASIPLPSDAPDTQPLAG
ncbi:MAG TPA: YhfC family glutamic-type intramembrane protease [Ktedonobacterales bacterium]|jgi:uncharacterized membrane protein YhfC|nr:YhfC family glutamic-type intramembrane protease [Ktedonobacterales bacterium]